MANKNKKCVTCGKRHGGVCLESLEPFMAQELPPKEPFVIRKARELTPDLSDTKTFISLSVSAFALGFILGAWIL